MSRVVVAWKPRSAKASAAASMSRDVRDVADGLLAPLGGEARMLVSLSGVGLGTVDSMPHPGETKQALSQLGAPSRVVPEEIHAPQHLRSRARGLPRLRPEFVERTLKPRAEQMLEVKAIDRDIWKEAG